MKARALFAIAGALAVACVSVVALVQRAPVGSPSATRVIATPLPTPRPTPAPSPTPTLVPPRASSPSNSPVATSTPAPPVPDERVRAAQQRLLELGYWLPAANGLKDASYAHAVTALQKVAGLPRDGILGTAAKVALAAGVRPKVRTTAGDAIEIDLARQVVIVVADGRPRLILDSSTGKPSTPTRTGRFSVYKEYDGLRVSRLGRLWRPKYFDGGRAIHGFTSVPPYPASHGCVRVTYAAMDHVWANDLMPIGTHVLAY